MIGLSTKIKEARENKKLTLDQLASAVDSSKSYIWQLEKDHKKKPSFEIVVKISKVLEIPLEFLADENEMKISEDQTNNRLLNLFNELSDESKQVVEILIKHLIAESNPQN